MRIWIAIGLLWVLCLNGLMKIGLHGWYQVNQTYLSQVLCINKDRPELHCKGKCILMQKLKQVDLAEEQADTPIPPPVVDVEWSVFLTAHASFHHPVQPELQEFAYWTDPHYTHDWVKEIFRPPTV
ncbi:hypothetical protein [Pontibacter sp. G13]|uniref:hypothetical protein n=1 Tax=Pontibacter sp. G13 TaxID=3074898 RepID=UPI00288AE309|nr:hypothetical protein [Pontibacter sp. G13]WNJ18664.1 hypothetical protein RJD25_27730 [Pontibacter sp. G13]